MAGRRNNNEHFVIYLVLVPAEVYQFSFSNNNQSAERITLCISGSSLTFFNSATSPSRNVSGKPIDNPHSAK
jgi:hypothetical protein